MNIVINGSWKIIVRNKEHGWLVFETSVGTMDECHSMIEYYKNQPEKYVYTAEMV